jgi:hypothetical protein
VSRLPLQPSHPERICWGCDKYCSAGDLACGNGTIRTMHPSELFGDDWLEWSDRGPGEPLKTDSADTTLMIRSLSRSE